MSSGTGLVGLFSSKGGLGTHTTITLFLPVREQGMEAGNRIFRRMFPGERQDPFKQLHVSVNKKIKCRTHE